MSASHPCGSSVEASATARPLRWLDLDGPTLAVVLLLAAGVVRVLLFALGDTPVTIVPDDAFYYFAVARHHAVHGTWSFDGVAPGSGFHLLWAYALEVAFRLRPQLAVSTIVTISASLGVALFAVAGGLVIAALRERWPRGGVIGVIAAFALYPQCYLPLMAMETPAVMLCAGLLVYLIYGPPRRGAALGALLCGIVGELARSDFGVWPFSLLIVAAGTTLLGRRPASSMRVPAAAFLGAVLGLATVLVHGKVVFGHAIPASLAVKSFWSVTAGHTPKPVLDLLGSMVDLRALADHAMHSPLVWLLACASIAVQAALRTLRREVWPPLAAAALAIAGYVALYARDSQGIQVWYAANLIVPAAVILGVAAAPLARVPGRAAYAAALVLLVASVPATTRPLYPWQPAMRLAGLRLRESPAPMRIGAWNAGIIAHYMQRPVVALDGLVNDDVVPFIARGDLAAYVAQRGLTHIVDFGEMFTPERRKRGGYSDGRLESCLTPLGPLAPDIPENRWGETTVLLFRLRPGCLSDGGRDRSPRKLASFGPR